MTQAEYECPDCGALLVAFDLKETKENKLMRRILIWRRKNDEKKQQLTQKQQVIDKLVVRISRAKSLIQKRNLSSAMQDLGHALAEAKEVKA